MPMSARSSNRNGTKVIWIGIHTSEGTSYGARGLRDATWWEGSSHAVSDDKELLDHNSGCVHPDRAAWTLRSGNPRSVNIEQVSYAKWSRSEWLNNHMPMLRHTARWVADMSKRFNIPITYVGTRGVQNRSSGVIQHNDYTVGTGDGTHWDCGPNYPIDVVIDLAREFAGEKPPPPPPPVPVKEDDFMPYREWPKADKDALLEDVKKWSIANLEVKIHGSGADGKGFDTEPLQSAVYRLSRMEATLGAQQSLLKTLLAEEDVDVKQLAADLAPLISADVSAQLGENTTLSAEELTAATEEGVRNALRSL